MSNQRQDRIEGIHKLPLFGAFGVALLAVLLVTGATFAKKEPSAAPVEDAVAERSLYFVDTREGSVLVYDAKSREKLQSFDRGQGAFVRISIRSLMRQRVLKGVDVKQPFKLVEMPSGNIFIVDPKGGDKIRVNAFGTLAIESFSQFLPKHHSAEGAEG